MSVSDTRSDEILLGEALNETKRFVYVNGAELTLISVCWFLFSLPVVTVGITTLGAYTAVASLRDGEGVNVRRVVDTVRGRIVGVTLLGVLPGIFAGVSVLYFTQYLTTGTTVAGLLAIVGAYAAVFVVLVFIPSFVSLAQCKPVAKALRDGYLWTANHPTLALATGLVTLLILCVTLLFLVAFPVLFAGVAFSFHTIIIETHIERPTSEDVTRELV